MRLIARPVVQLTVRHGRTTTSSEAIKTANEWLFSKSARRRM